MLLCSSPDGLTISKNHNNNIMLVIIKILYYCKFVSSKF